MNKSTVTDSTYLKRYFFSPQVITSTTRTATTVEPVIEIKTNVENHEHKDADEKYVYLTLGATTF